MLPRPFSMSFCDTHLMENLEHRLYSFNRVSIEASEIILATLASAQNFPHPDYDFRVILPPTTGFTANSTFSISFQRVIFHPPRR